MEQIIVTLPARPAEEGPASQVAAVGNSALQQLSAISPSIVREPSTLYYVLKRITDIALALFGILVLMPVFLTIALCIKLDDRGAVFHFREIIGYHGRRFFALKFRTMIP
ncbi:MAG: sugar transferase, partial [Chloroflexota bacterium]|nr:sugar transferase [Chloroflexota bacterium]